MSASNKEKNKDYCSVDAETSDEFRVHIRAIIKH
jgi:hypothetical protein